MSEEKPKRPHLSASSLDLFSRCPEAWRRRYIEHEKRPPGLAAHKGRAIHRGAEFNMRQKLETHEDLPVDDVVAYSVETFKDLVQSESYVVSKNDEPLDKMTDKVAQMAKVHIVEQAPDYQPKLVEHTFRVELPALTHDIVGVVDLVVDTGEIVDFKTSKRSYSGSEADVSVQLDIYAASLADLEHNPVTVKLDIAIEPSARRPARRQVIESTRDSSDLPIIGQRLAVVSRTIDAGLFPPASVGSWWCTESWCGYWHSCPYVNSQRIEAAKQTEIALRILDKQ